MKRKATSLHSNFKVSTVTATELCPRADGASKGLQYHHMRHRRRHCRRALPFRGAYRNPHPPPLTFHLGACRTRRPLSSPLPLPPWTSPPPPARGDPPPFASPALYRCWWWWLPLLLSWRATTTCRPAYHLRRLRSYQCRTRWPRPMAGRPRPRRRRGRWQPRRPRRGP